MVEQRRQLALKKIKEYSHRNVLEVGCGLHPLFLEFGGFDSMTVVEPAEEFLANANRLLRSIPKRRASRISLVNGYAEECLKKPGFPKFDFVFVLSLLHEVPNPSMLAKAVRGSLLPGGVAMFSTNNANSLHRLLALEMGLIKSTNQPSKLHKEFERHSIYTVESLRSLMAKSGFSIVEEWTSVFKPFAHYQMEQLLKSKALGKRILSEADKLIKYFPQFGAELYIVVRSK